MSSNRHAAGTQRAGHLPGGPFARFLEVVFGVAPTPRWRAACACGWSSLGRTTDLGQAEGWALDHVLAVAR